MLDEARRQFDARSGLISPTIRDGLSSDFFDKQGIVASKFDDRRRYVRRYYRLSREITIGTTLPAFPRPSETIRVLMRDFSRTGVGFLCEREFYPGETLKIEFAEIGLKAVAVKRCLRLYEGCFEIGCEFIG